jgi:hypothetical protein
MAAYEGTPPVRTGGVFPLFADFAMNAWWRAQSWSNPSPQSDSLLTGKRSGILAIL